MLKQEGLWHDKQIAHEIKAQATLLKHTQKYTAQMSRGEINRRPDEKTAGTQMHVVRADVFQVRS